MDPVAVYIVHDGPILSELANGLALKWRTLHDTNYPYGDQRQSRIKTVWTIDLVNEILFFYKLKHASKLHFDCLRERRVTLADFEQCNPPMAPTFDLTRDFPPPYWEPTIETNKRNEAFARHLLRDFDYQWRHILRQRYNDNTFRKLAAAIIRMVLSDFRVVEFTGSRKGNGTTLVRLLDVPEWDEVEAQIFWTGSLWVVACQDPKDSLPLIRRHFATQKMSASGRSTGKSKSETKYLVLSVRHVILCRALGDKLEWTKAKPLLNGKDSVSHQAIRLLLAAVPQMPRTLLHSLPVELQDMILEHVSKGPVEAARLACILGLGSPFSWKIGELTLELETIQNKRRKDCAPVESQIWFGDHLSGILYVARRDEEVGRAARLRREDENARRRRPGENISTLGAN